MLAILLFFVIHITHVSKHLPLTFLPDYKSYALQAEIGIWLTRTQACGADEIWRDLTVRHISPGCMFEREVGNVVDEIKILSATWTDIDFPRRGISSI